MAEKPNQDLILFLTLVLLLAFVGHTVWALVRQEWRSAGGSAATVVAGAMAFRERFLRWESGRSGPQDDEPA